MAKKDPFAPEYEIKHINIKTGEHFRDKKGNEYTVVSNVAISSKEKKELVLFDWKNGKVIGMEKQALVTHLNILGVDKVNQISLHRQHGIEDDERCRWFKIKGKMFTYMVDMQKFQLFTRLS